MKKIFYAFLMMAAATAPITFTACGDDDEVSELIKGSYKFYEPIMVWNSSVDEVRAQMKSMSEWREEPDNEQPGELCYVNKKTQADMRYEFEDGKLTSSSVTYFGCNDQFDQMKNDWAKALNLTWRESTMFSIPYYEASCAGRECTVSVQQNVSSGISYMIVDFRHTRFLW